MKKRYLTFDALKGIGIIVLILCHHIAWLFVNGSGAGLRYQGSQEIFDFVVKSVFYLGLPFWGFFFPFLAGASTYFYLKKESTTVRKFFSRVIGLVFLGFFMNFFAWGISDTFTWDVLPFVALCILVSYLFIKNLDDRPVFICLFLLGAFSLYLSDKFPFASFGSHYIYDIILGDREGYNYWPFFPWFSVFAAGIFVGYFWEKNNNGFLKLMPWIGLLFLGISYLTRSILPVVKLERIWGAVVFKPSPFYVLAVIGFGLLMVGLWEHLLKIESFKTRIRKSFLVVYGRSVLWVYIFSTILGSKLSLVLRSFCDNIVEALFVFPFVVVINLMICYVFAEKITSAEEIEYQ